MAFPVRKLLDNQIALIKIWDPQAPNVGTIHCARSIPLNIKYHPPKKGFSTESVNWGRIVLGVCNMIRKMIGKTDEYLAISTQIKLTGFDFSKRQRFVGSTKKFIELTVSSGQCTLGGGRRPPPHKDRTELYQEHYVSTDFTCLLYNRACKKHHYLTPPKQFLWVNQVVLVKNRYFFNGTKATDNPQLIYTPCV